MSMLAKLFGKKTTSKKSKPKKVAVKKPKSAKRKIKSPAKRTAAKPPKRKIVKKLEKKQEPIGRVTHYFPKVKAAVVKIKKGSIAVGDTLRIKGHTTNFTQKISSLQINNSPIKKASKGSEIGLRVKSRARHNDLVYKVK